MKADCVVVRIVESKLVEVEREPKKMTNDESNTLEYYSYLRGNSKDRKYALMLNNFNNIPMKYEVIKNMKVRQIVKINEKEIILRKVLIEVKVNGHHIFNCIE